MWKHKTKWLLRGGRKVRCYLCGKKILAKGDLFLFHQDTGYYSHQSCMIESTAISGNERRRAVKKIAVGAAVVGAIAAGAGKFLDVSSQSKNSSAAQTILTSQGLIPPALTSDPSNPVPGQMWYRSDAGVMAHFDAVQNRVVYSSEINDGNVHVTSKGIINGLSVLPNDGTGWFGPDTTKGATAPGQYGSPYTETLGIQEGVSAGNKVMIKYSATGYPISAQINISHTVYIEYESQTVYSVQGSGTITMDDAIYPTTEMTAVFNVTTILFGLTFVNIAINGKGLASYGIYNNNLETNYQNGTPYYDHVAIVNCTVSGILDAEFNPMFNAIQLNNSGTFGSTFDLSITNGSTTVTLTDCYLYGNGLYTEVIFLNIFGGVLQTLYLGSSADSIELVGVAATQTNTNVLFYLNDRYINNLTIIGGFMQVPNSTGAYFFGGAGYILNFYAKNVGWGIGSYSTGTVNASFYDTTYTTFFNQLFIGTFKMEGCYIAQFPSGAPLDIPNFPMEISQTSNGGGNGTGAGVFTRIKSSLLISGHLGGAFVNPPVSGTIYQNTNPYEIEIELPVYATTASTAGYVTVAKGVSDTPTAIGNQYVSGNTSSTATQIIRLKVPALWYYEFTGSGVTFGTASIFAT